MADWGLRSMGLGVAMILASEPARAEAEKDADSPIIITGQRPGYGVNTSSSSTKIAISLLDTPQSVSVIAQPFIEDAALRSIADVIRFTSGATIGQGEGHRDQVTLRGNNTTADFFQDGLRDDVQYFRPLYNLERVEVLKGANALAFGRGGGGGVINRVTKVAQVGEAFASVFGGVDTFGAYAIEGDVNAPIGDSLALRVNAVYEDARNHRDVFALERAGINPTLVWAPDARTQVILSYEYLNDFRVVDRGIPSFGGLPLQGVRDRFFGVEGINESQFGAHVVRLRGQHAFTEAVSLSGQFLYGDYDKAYRNVFPATAVSFNPVTGQGTFGVEAYFDPTARRNVFGQVNLVWKTATGAITHTFLGGVEVGDQLTANERINGFFDSGVPTTVSGRRTVVSLQDPLVVPPITFRAGSGNRAVRTDAEILSVYVQDQAVWGPVTLIAGGRFDRFDLTVDNLLAGQSFSRLDEVFSPRAGLIYKPIPAASIYASYARSFLPQSGEQFLSLDVTSAALIPERFDTYEIGAKWDIAPGLNVSAAIYQLERTNTRAPSGQGGVIVLTGESRARGFELNFVGALSQQWQVLGAYTFQDAEITGATAAAPAGRTLGQVPRHILSIWSRNDFTRRFGAALGLQHQRDSFATISNATILPAFTRLDAALYWRLTDRLEAQVNIENLTNALYFPTAHTDDNITTGAPVNARFTLRAKF